MPVSRRTLLAGAATAALAGTSPPAFADDYPSKPIRLIVGFAPGASTDLSARIVADAISKTLGQPVVVENRPGAGSAIAIDYVAKSAPDGYTLLQCNSDGVSALPAVKPSTSYRPDSLAYISRLIENPVVLAINPALPMKTMAELIAYAKANPPGKLRSGTSGVGGIPDLTTLLLSQQTGIEITRVPYGGTAPALTDMLGGFIEMAFITPSTVGPYAKAGKVRLLATTAPHRDPNWPDVPTMAESGLPGLTVEVWYGITGPAALPQNVLDRLRKAVVDALHDPAVKDRLAKANLEAAPLAGDDFKKFAEDEYQRWARVAKAANIVLK